MKTNPKRIPRSEADVRKARDDGIKDGSGFTSVIFLSVLTDKFGFDQQKIIMCYKAVMKLSEELAEIFGKIGRVRKIVKKGSRNMQISFDGEVKRVFLEGEI